MHSTKAQLQRQDISAPALLALREDFILVPSSAGIRAVIRQATAPIGIGADAPETLRGNSDGRAVDLKQWNALGATQWEVLYSRD